MFDLLSSEPCTTLIGWYVLLGAWDLEIPFSITAWYIIFGCVFFLGFFLFFLYFFFPPPLDVLDIYWLYCACSQAGGQISARAGVSNPELAGQGEGAAPCLGRTGGLHPWGPSMGTHRGTALVIHGVLQPKLRWPAGLGACRLVGWWVLGESQHWVKVLKLCLSPSPGTEVLYRSLFMQLFPFPGWILAIGNILTVKI